MNVLRGQLINVSNRLPVQLKNMRGHADDPQFRWFGISVGQCMEAPDRHMDRMGGKGKPRGVRAALGGIDSLHGI
jgi:hypothetical protein